MTGRDLAGEIGFAARELKAPVIAQVFAQIGDQARDEVNRTGFCRGWIIPTPVGVGFLF